jgi:crotonobetainyl-CoA:carnitine CoA-transferase CaiB-like acyl-CoA transferase
LFEEEYVNLALEGIKVIDVSQVAAAPMAARHLADFGADVIHIEHPVHGDSWRVYQPGIAQGTQGVPSKINYNWENYNRNKRSLTLDLSQDAGQKILYKMIETADVFVTNLRMFEQEKYKLEYQALKDVNPRLIYALITGYGKEGPDKNNPAYDTTAYFARSGMCHMLSNVDGSLGSYRPAFGDNVAALGLFAGIMTALFTRERTGEGQEVEMSLMHTGVYQISYDVAGALVTRRDYDEWRRHSIEDIPNILEMSYKTKEGRWGRLNCVQPDNYYARVCHAIGRDDLINDPRFVTFEPRLKNKVALYEILVDAFSKKTLEEWKTLMVGIPFAPVQNLLEIIDDPQAIANNFYVTYDHPAYGKMQGVANPIKMSRTPATIRRPAPEFSQHTEEVLLEYGYTWEDISRYKDQGTIA